MSEENETPKSIIEKVKKLLALSKSSNINEATNAATIAAELIDKYRISMATLEVAAAIDLDPINVADQPLFSGGRLSVWKESLAYALAKHFNCSAYSEGAQGNRRFKLCGRQSDVELLRFMFSYLVCQIEVHSIVACHGHGKSYSNSFKMGACAGIRSQFSAMKEALRKASEANCTAMIKLDDIGKQSKAMMYKIVPHLRSTTLVGKVSSGDAYIKGKVFGSSLNLSSSSKLLT